MNIRCYDIEWDEQTEDGSGTSAQMPTECNIEVDSEDFKWAEFEGPETLNDLIVNALSDASGWLVKCFEWTKTHKDGEDTTNIRIKCWYIDWDTEGRGQCGLPSEVELEFDGLWWKENVHDDADEEAAVFGELSDKYGFKVFNCEYARV